MWDSLRSSAASPLLGVFCCRRVGLAGGLLPDLHSLDTREGLAGAVLPGMISGDWVVVPYSRLGQAFWYVLTILGVFCCRRVGLAGGLLPDLHSLDTREGLAGAVLPGMISGDWVVVPYSRLGQAFWYVLTIYIVPFQSGVLL
ncbi:hypothetical protein ACLB2K_030501 [Fragaria x ananassa]